MNDIATLATDCAAKRADFEAKDRAAIDARHIYHLAADTLRKAMVADAADQIGFEMKLNPTGELRKIADVVPHWRSPTLLIPLMVTRTKAGAWGKRANRVDTIGFDRETRTWRPVKVDQSGVFTFTA